jgi:hypothetical protein
VNKVTSTNRSLIASRRRGPQSTDQASGLNRLTEVLCRSLCPLLVVLLLLTLLQVEVVETAVEVVEVAAAAAAMAVGLRRGHRQDLRVSRPPEAT